MKKISSDNLLLILILIVGIVLRFYNFAEIPFTYDEFSALKRTSFSNLNDLFIYGIYVDGHPALIQLLIFFLVKIAGWSSIVIKLPFLIFGIASIYLVFIIGKKWFNVTAGLIAGALVATMQYPLMYSQIARPYISGMFFSLLLFWSWSNYVFDSKNEKKWNWHLIGIIVFDALCAYNHYYSLLFAFILGLSGLFFLKRKKMIPYLISNVAAVLLFLPHINITLYQLSMGGVGQWLGKPDGIWIWNFMQYIFNYSVPLIIFSGIALLFGIAIAIKNRAYNPIYFLCFLLFILVYFTGYFYSIYINPTLQFSTLIVVYPFLLFVFFGLLPDLNKWKKIILVGFILAMGSYSLIFAREHYTVFYKSVYREIITESHNTFLNAKRSALYLIAGDTTRTNFYVQGYKDIPFVYLLQMDNYKNLQLLLENAEMKKVSFGYSYGIDPTIISVIQYFYPAVEKKLDFHLGNYFLFAKDSAKNDALIHYQSINGFEQEAEGWGVANVNNISDSLAYNGKKCYVFRQGEEWGASFYFDLTKMILNKYQQVELSLQYKAEKETDIQNLLLVFSLESGDSVIDWRAMKLENFCFVPQKWNYAAFRVNLCDLNLQFPDIKIKCYLWNQNKNQIYIDDFCIRICDGNPLIFGWFNKLSK